METLPRSPTRRIGVRCGDWDLNAGFLGVPRSGKSATAAALIEDHRRDVGAYVLVHDASRTYPRDLPDGRVLDIESHGSIDSAERALKDPARALRIHSIAVEDAVPVVQLAHKIGEASKRAAGGEGRTARPVICHIEEVTDCEEMHAGGRLGPTLKRAVNLRRHMHCGLTWTAQSAMAVHQQVLSKATSLYVFRLESEPEAQHLVRWAGFPQESAAEIQNLQQFYYLLKVPRGF